MRHRWKLTLPNGRSRGQALVEFSLALIPFVLLMMGVVDLGRGIYVYNGVAQASREIARVTSVHPGSDFRIAGGRSAETNAVIAAQKGLVPGLADPSTTISIECTDVGDNLIDITDPLINGCRSDLPSGAFVRVSISVRFTVLTPLLGLANPFTFSSASHVQVP